MIAELGFTIIFVIPLLAGELSRTANGGADPSHNDTAFRLRENEGTLANDCIVFRLTPVHPPPPAPPYPPGTIVDTDNNTITLRGGEDQTVWFDVMISNWGCVGTLETWQAMIGEDRLLPPGIEGIHPPCSSDSDCAAAGFGPIINQGKLGYRGAWCVDFINPNECSTVWEDENRPDWLAFDIATWDYFRRICGGTGLNTPDIIDDGVEHYAMSVVLGIEASFVGTVEIPFQVDDFDTFVFITGVDVGMVPGKAIPATVIVPTGACCFGVGSAAPGCSDDLTLSECEALPGPAHDFHADQACGQIQCSQRGACCDTLEGTCSDLALENECADGLNQWSAGASCAEVECVSPVIPTVSGWGLVMLVLGLLVMSKVRGPAHA